MLQIDHIYEFFWQEIFNDFVNFQPTGGIVKLHPNINLDINVACKDYFTSRFKIFFYDQEPFLPKFAVNYIKVFKFPSGYNLDELYQKKIKYDLDLPGDSGYIPDYETHLLNLANPSRMLKEADIFVTSEKSQEVNLYLQKYNMLGLYYFFHGFAAMDWYRGFHALNYNKQIVKDYNYDFIAFNRIINNDRSYRIYFVSLLKEAGLLDKGLVSFGVADDLFDNWCDEVADPKSKLSERAKQHIKQNLTGVSKLVIDHAELPGSASADIARGHDAFWNIVTETVFYYDKLHLTEKIFKPIVSKQPFMLLAAPGNLAYLKSYGFKTFDSVIDESYDSILDNDLRSQAVVDQLQWYCNLSPGEKQDIIRALEPIIQYNFDHFYGDFRHIIANELLTNCQTLFKDIGYDDSHINYATINNILSK